VRHHPGLFSGERVLGQTPNFSSHKPSMSIPVLAKTVVTKPTPRRPDGITFLSGIALLGGIMLLFAGISLAIPWYPNWTYGPGPGWVLDYPMFRICRLRAVLTHAVPRRDRDARDSISGCRDRSLFGTPMGVDPRHNIGFSWSSVEHSPNHHIGSIRFPCYTWANCNSIDIDLSHDPSR